MRFVQVNCSHSGGGASTLRSAFSSSHPYGDHLQRQAASVGQNSRKPYDDSDCRRVGAVSCCVQEQCPDSSPDSFIVATPRGEFMDSNNYRKRVLRKCGQELGLPKLNFQVIRLTIHARSEERDCEGCPSYSATRTLGHNDRGLHAGNS
jgi:hypothetical protein